MIEQLVNHLKKFPTAPFLFIGSGFSRRYLNTDNWKELLQRFSSQTKYPFEYYRASAGDNYPKIATELASVFHELWWNEPKYSHSVQKFGPIASNRESALKIEISNRLTTISGNIKLIDSLAPELEALKHAVIDGIITTNWDTLIEQIFPDFTTYIGQDELLFSEALGVGEIYKIHGCCTQPNSLILTHQDYSNFENRNAYLAAKLLTFFVEHPIIFLGYSMTDTNVGQILRSIGTCLTTKNISQLQDRLIFVNWNPYLTAPEMSTSSIVMADNYSIPVIQIQTPTFLPVFESLRNLPRAFPARILRKLKDHIYSLIKTNDPKGKLYVKDIDSLTGPLDDVEIVYGVGAISAVRELGYKAITRNDIIEDLIFGNKSFDPHKILFETFPDLFKQNKYLPVFKYLRDAGRLSSNGILINSTGLDPKIVEATSHDMNSFAPHKQYIRRARGFVDHFKTFSAFTAKHGLSDVVMHGAAFPAKAFDLEHLKSFITEYHPKITQENPLVQTNFIKLICIYDMLCHSSREFA